MASSSAQLTLRYFFVDFLVGIAAFPLWWYSRGLGYAISWARHSIRNFSAMIGFTVWTSNVFVPMYGDYAWSGRLISFVVRLLMILVLGMAIIAWSAFACLLFVFYLLALPAAVLGMLFHAGGILAT